MVEAADGRGQSAGEVETGEVQGDDEGSEGVAGNAGPGAMAIGRVPGIEGPGGVMDGGFEGEKGVGLRHVLRRCRSP